MPSDMSPEDELCLLLARGQLSPAVRERALELLSAPLHWDLLQARAHEHQVFPLLYRNLRLLEFQGVPEPARTQLENDFRANAAWNAFLAHELARVLRLLNHSGVPVIPLKGVALAESLYGDPALRVCADVDILVPHDEALRVRRLILAHGYTSPFKEEFFVSHQFRAGGEWSLIRENLALPYLLEVHWTLLHHSSNDAGALEELWSEVTAKEFFGVPAYALTLEWQFLHLAWHATYHRWHTLKWLADIHDLCVSAPIDWQKVRDKADRFGLDWVVGPTLTACSSLFGTPLPPQLTPGALPADVQLFPASRAPSQMWDAPLFYPRLLKRPSEKLRYWAENIFVPQLSDARIFRLPSSFSFLYYALRPLRLISKWSWLVLRAFVGRLVGGLRRYHSSFGLRTLLAICMFRLFGRPKEIFAQPPGISHPIRLRLGTTDLSVYENVMLREEYAFDLPYPPSTIIDAGANIGTASIYFAHRYPETKVIALEPEPTNFELLVRNVRHYPAIIPVRAALWSRDGEVSVRQPDPGHGIPGKWGSVIRESPEANVRAITMRTLIKEMQVQSVDLLKVNIEGAEKEVFEACDWMDSVGCLIIELHDRFKPGCSAAVDAVAREFSKSQRDEITFYLRQTH